MLPLCTVQTEATLRSKRWFVSYVDGRVLFLILPFLYSHQNKCHSFFTVADVCV